MVTPADVRKLALALPEAAEQDHWGNPSFRVRGKIFATLQVNERTAVLKLSPDEQESLASMQPEAFEIIRWGKQGWTRVTLPKVDRGLLEELLATAWRSVAPKRAIAVYEGTPGAKKAKKRSKRG